MRLRIWLLTVFLVFAVSLAAQTGPPNLYTRTISALWLPVEVKTPDGRTVPPGEYRVELRRVMLQPVSPPSITLGYVSGPTLVLTRLSEPPDGGAVRRHGSELAPPMIVLYTASEVRVLFDMPAQPLDRQFAAYGSPRVAPLIRHRVLEGIVYGDQLLQIRGSSAGSGVHGGFLRVLPKKR